MSLDDINMSLSVCWLGDVLFAPTVLCLDFGGL